LTYCLLSFGERNRWRDAGLFNLEAGKIFFDRHSFAPGYGFDLWGDAEIRNAAIVSLGYLF
jgi:hypothetical protein